MYLNFVMKKTDNFYVKLTFWQKNEPDFLRSGPFKIYCHDYRLSNAAFTSA